VSYIKEQQLTLADVGRMARAGKTAAPPIDDELPWDEETYIENFTMPNIKKFLDQHLIGQDAAKKAMAQILYTTYEHDIVSTNLFIGPTGCGKTELARTVDNEFRTACTWLDASCLSAEGWKGSVHLSDTLKSIRRDGHKKILFIDEIDKLLDIRGNEVEYHLLIQDELLKLFDHDKALFTDCISPEDLTIVCMGAFSKIYEKKGKKEKRIGFSAYDKEEEKDIVIDANDLIEAGFKAELIGRFDRIVQMDAPTLETYKQIANKELWKLAERFDKGINIHDDDMYAIAQEALTSGLGARKIRSMLRARVEDYIYDHPYADVIDLCNTPAAEM